MGSELRLSLLLQGPFVGLLEASTLDVGKMAYKMELEHSHGSTAITIMENGSKEDKLEREFSSGRVEMNTTANGWTTLKQERENFVGPPVTSMMAIGFRTRKKVRVHFFVMLCFRFEDSHQRYLRSRHIHLEHR